jgi:hypothetical protein
MRTLNYRLILSAIALLACLCGPGARFASAQGIPIPRPEQARCADDFVDSIGVNTHLGYTGSIYARYDSLIKPRLKDLGVRHIRDGFFQEKLLPKYADMAGTGIKLTLILRPERAVSQAKSVLPYLDAIEGQNEPDHGDWVDATRKEQKQLYQALRKDPMTRGIKVLVPAMANTRDSALKLGSLVDALDIGNFHPYAAGKPPTSGGWGISLLEAIRRARTVCGGQPLWATECGYHNRLEEAGHPGVTETAMAKYFPRLFLTHFNLGIERSFSYELADLKPDPAMQDIREHFGLLHNDGSPKPAYTALQNTITLLKDPGPDFKPGALSYALGGDLTDIQHTLLQKRDGTFYLILWQEATSYDIKTHTDLPVQERPVTLILETPIRQMFLYRPNVRIVPITLYNRPRQVPLSVPDAVLILQLIPR